MQTARRLVKGPDTAETRKKALCIIGGESEALGFHQETARSVLYKLYIIFYGIKIRKFCSALER